MILSSSNVPNRHRTPRIIDTDWLVRRGLAKAVAAVVTAHVAKGDTILDFGCGTRPYAPVVAQRGARYLGADLDGGDVAIDSGGSLQMGDSSVDVVGSFQVLEHVRDVPGYLAEARRVLRPEGLLVLSTHGTWLHHPHPEDHRRWTREGLIGELENAQFEVLECWPIVGPLAWTTVLRLTGFGFMLRKIPLVGRAMSAALSLVMNARAWLEDRLTPAHFTKDNACVYLTVGRRR